MGRRRQATRISPIVWSSYIQSLKRTQQVYQNDLLYFTNVISPAQHKLKMDMIDLILMHQDIQEQLRCEMVYCRCDSTIRDIMHTFKRMYQDPNLLHIQLNKLLNPIGCATTYFLWPRTKARRNFLRFVWIMIQALRRQIQEYGYLNRFFEQQFTYLITEHQKVMRRHALKVYPTYIDL
jgi:hypothetical protein